MIEDELMELIQRDLDGDLTREEKAWLHMQLQANPAAQLMYQRLKRVSDELASLPLVTPRYSLVDAILPELEATRMEQAAMAVPAEPAVPPAIPLVPKNQGEQTGEKRRRLPLWMAKAGAGAVAASLFVGIWLASQAPSDPTNQGSAPVIQELTLPEATPPQPEPPEPSVPPAAKPDDTQGQTAPAPSGQTTSPPAGSERQPTPAKPSAGDADSDQQPHSPAANNSLPSGNRTGQSLRPDQPLKAQPPASLPPQANGVDQKDEKREQGEKDDEKKDEKKGQVKPDKEKEKEEGGSSGNEQEKGNEKEKEKEKEDKEKDKGKGNGNGNGNNKGKEKSANTIELPLLPFLNVTLGD